MDLQPSEGTHISKTFGTILRDNKAVNKQALILKASPKYDSKIYPPIPPKFHGKDEWSSFLSPIKNQGDCGACYVFSVIGMLADRIAILSGGALKPDLNPLEGAMCMVQIDPFDEFTKSLADEELLSKIFQKQSADACSGNTLYNAARYVYIEGGVEESCVPITTITDFMKNNANRLPVCTAIEGIALDHCVDPKLPQRFWTAHSYYKVGHAEDVNLGDELEKDIQLEIMKNGPISIGFSVYQDLLDGDFKDPEKIYVPRPGQKPVGGHAVRIVGWGTSSSGGTKYWQCANSWGPEWGDQGYFKMVRSDPMLQLELNTIAVLPEFPGHHVDPGSMFGFNIDPLSDDKKIKDSFELDESNLYTKRTIEKIKSGEYIGSLAPVVEMSKLPPNIQNDDDSYWAYTVSGGGSGSSRPIKVSSTRSTTGGNKKINWLWYLLATVTIVILTVLITLYYCRRR